MKITIIAHPNARQAKVEIDLTGQLHVYVTEPPLEGKANLAVIKAVAKHFKVKKNQIHLVSGETAKQKTFLIGIQ